MKRIIVIAFTALSSLIISCGNQDNTSASDTATEINTDSSSVNTAGSGDSMAVPEKGSGDVNRSDTTKMSN
ncbi:MAG: hypothetical protein ACTHJ5_15200 [Ilyomonas sp.]